MKKILKWLAIAFVGITVLGIVINANKTPEQKAAEAAALSERKAAETAQQQEQAKQELATLPTVTAKAIAKAYNDNTVAADQQFKGKKFKVTGIVAEISTDFTGDPYLALRGGINLFMEPQFKFDGDASGQIAKLKKGSKVTLICTGAGDVAKTPMSDSCVLIN